MNTFAHCLAQITVNEPSFAPYKYVYFEAGTTESQKAVESNQPEMIYFFYDREGMTIKEITDALDEFAGVKNDAHIHFRDWSDSWAEEDSDFIIAITSDKG